MTTQPRNPHVEHLEEVPLAGSSMPVSKLQAVRDYLAQHPRATDEQIVAALAARGISIPDDYPASVRRQGQESEADHETVVEALQSILAQHGKTSPEALAAALQKRGFNVTPAYAESLRAAIQHS